MQRSIFLVLASVTCAVLLCAGCISTTSPQGNVTPATGTPAATIALAPLALVPADLPGGFTLQSARQKSPDEMGSVAKDLGWQEGYVATYVSPENETANATMITQTITVYNAENISAIVSLVDANERQQSGLQFTALPLPATGPDTRALSAVTVNTTPASSSSGSLAALQSEPGSSAPVPGYIEAIFGKGQVLEVIRMTGPGAQYDMLKTLAETAYAKLG